MLDTITIKINTPANPLDIGCLAECLLFYDHTKLFVDKNSLKELFELCGVDEIQELLERGCLSIYTKGDILGASDKGDVYGADLYSIMNDDLHYRAFFESFSSLYENQIGKARRHARRFASITNSFKYDLSIIDDIENSVRDTKFIRQIISRFITAIGLEKEFVGKEWYYDFVPINEHEFNHYTNLDLDRLKTLSEEKQLHFDFSPTSLLLDLSESLGDIQIAIKNNSEIFTTPVNSKIISLKFDNIFEGAKINHDTISQFQKIVLPNYRDLASIINSGGKNYNDLIGLIDKAERFKTWKRDIPNEANFIEEYFKALEKDSWLNKLPVKIGRFSIFEGLGILFDIFGAGGLGTLATTTLSAADSFILDKILNRWKPNQFVKGDLNKFLKEK